MSQRKAQQIRRTSIADASHVAFITPTEPLLDVGNFSVVETVRREKALDLQRVQVPPGNWVAPAGSNRSGGGGNEAVGAFDAKGRLGDSASRQAVTRVNAEQASKRIMWEPTRREYGEGRRRWGRGRANEPQRSHRGNGDGMSAEEIRRNTGSPSGERRVTANRTPARDRPGRLGWRRGP